MEDTKTLVLSADPRAQSRAHPIVLSVVEGPDLGKVVSVNRHRITIGTDPNANLPLTDPSVSRRHAVLLAEATGLRVLDEGSRNGVFCDGLRVRDAYLRPDSVLGLGETRVLVSVSPRLIELEPSPRDRFGGLLGASMAMRRVFALLERVASTDLPVLIEGETGTGKEVTANAIHEESARAGEPFVVFDCSAVPEPLVESELFGHVRGAFTGAVADRTGAFELADRGTLFLDEIGELPLALQPKLLRALERLEVRPVGSNQVRTVDVRIVAATNRNLAEEVVRGRFREDLYYRLNVVRVLLPALRHRREDIPLLARSLARSAPRLDHAAALTDAVLEELSGRAWPGNVRELRNAVFRMVAAGLGSHPAAPAPSIDEVPLDFSLSLVEARNRHAAAFEEAYVREALRRSGGSLSKAAALLGVSDKFVQRAMKKYQLRSPPA